MKVELRNNKDFLAGLLLVGIGALGFYTALDYPFGSALRMGPGYFPRVLSGIMIAFGLFILIRGILAAEKVKGVWGWKALAFIMASFVVFGWTMDRFGFIPALVAMFFLATLGGHEFKWKEVVILTAIMTVFAIGVFIYGLGMPYQLIQGF